MSKLPLVSGKELVKALCRFGYYVRDQKGSHIHLRHPCRIPLTIPNHDEISRGTLKAILRDAGISTEELLEVL
ncbi:MAG: type II toxin-antitoxin system HicA family toxin [Candidatus Thermoplasmatota archaeon]